MERRKPEGVALVEFCRRWDTGSHIDKVNLATEWGVTYETARNWRSISVEVPHIPKMNVVTIEPPNEPSVDVKELIGQIPTNVNLDFVSFDIETSNLKADFSILLTACIKPYGQDTIVFRCDQYPDWYLNRKDDSAIVKDIAEELSKHAVVITHYGSKFDIPYLRAKMSQHQLSPLPRMFGLDTWRIAKSNFAVSSRRLDGLSAYFFDGEKHAVDGKLWMAALVNGDTKAIDEIVEHNVQDVILLEKLASLSFPFVKAIRTL